MGSVDRNYKVMRKVEDSAVLVAFFALVVTVFIGIYHLVEVVPNVYKAPIGLCLGSGVIALVFRIVRKSV